MAWLFLALAGLLEIVFAVSSKLMDGHRNLTWSIVFYVSLVLSLAFLQEAARTIPIGTAYAVWTGIGGAGTALVGMAFMGDPATPLRIAFIGLLMVSLVGLKMTSGH